MQFIGKVADFILLNLLTLVCSLPIITFGAAYTAKYYVSMKIVRGEEGTLFKAYFKAFKDNFKQATIIWIIQIIVDCLKLSLKALKYGLKSVPSSPRTIFIDT